MRRTLRFIVPALILVLIIGLLACFMAGKGISTGVCLVTDRGDCIIVLDDSPVVMGNQTGGEDAFDGLETGDRLWILHDGIQESYPGQTGVYLFLRRGEGGMTDIPIPVLDSLRELGWIS